MNENQANEQAAALARGSSEVISPAELAAKLALGRPLRIKLGMDPTAPDLHLGHSLTLKKLRDFQDAGHTVIFLVGDFTAMIGDPTGRSETRKPLSRDQIERNAETYRAQAFKILDRERTEVRFNSEWMNELGVRRLIEIAAKVSVARLLERDDFEKRLADEEPLFLHELLYPVIQGYDSVALEADLEIGGTDQKFNMLVGRELQRHFGQAPQAVMTMPLLEGLDGVRKMSKSYGNYVGLTDKPEDMYGKLMSVPDQLMVRYYELLTKADAGRDRGGEVGRIASDGSEKTPRPRDRRRIPRRARRESRRAILREQVPAPGNSSQRAGVSNRRGSVDLRTDEAVTVHAFDQRGAAPGEPGSGAGGRPHDNRCEFSLRAGRAQGARSGQAPSGAD